ncbi:MAG: DoxX family protein [Sandaracinaceae bacterium]
MSEPSKPQKVLYWVLTVFLVAGEAASGVANLLHAEAAVGVLTALGYPIYLLLILGPLKLAGGVVLVVPGVPRLKEWAYAGFAFVFIGGAASQVFSARAALDIASPIVTLAVLAGSYAARPEGRRL